MEIINGTALQRLVDYDFGDHMGAASIPRPVGGFMKEASEKNTEFLEKCKEFEGKVMTLFIDNIRLYNRPVLAEAGNDAEWVSYLLANNDLLALCAKLPNKFVIFTSHEDTPIDAHIKIPDNVLGIHAVNAEYFGGKIHPFPYGLQRELGNGDDRLEIMRQNVREDKHYDAHKLLYINCGIGRNEDRKPLSKFETNDWVTTRFDKDSKFFPYSEYQTFLNELRDHKFVVCPRGHGIDCHRNWETLYMRRVPIMKNHPYFHKLMEGWPVLWVNDWSDITLELLKENDYLYKMSIVMDLSTLDLKRRFDTIMANYRVKI